MNSGRFNHRVTIQQLTGAAGHSGHVNVNDNANWSDVVSRMAEIVESTGREYQQQSQLRADITHRVTLLLDDETYQITPKMRVKWADSFFGQSRTRYLNIENRIYSKGARIVIQLQCKELIDG